MSKQASCMAGTHLQSLAQAHVVSKNAAGTLIPLDACHTVKHELHPLPLVGAQPFGQHFVHGSWRALSICWRLPQCQRVGIYIIAGHLDGISHAHVSLRGHFFHMTADVIWQGKPLIEFRVMQHLPQAALSQLATMKVLPLRPLFTVYADCMRACLAAVRKLHEGNLAILANEFTSGGGGGTGGSGSEMGSCTRGEPPFQGTNLRRASSFLFSIYTTTLPQRFSS